MRVGVGIEPEDGAQVEAGRVVEGQAVGLGAGQGLLVGIDLPLADRLEPHPRQEPLARVLLALDLECLVVDVKGGVIVLAENALRSQSLRNRAARA